MTQKHLQLLRNASPFADYQTAYNALTGMTGYADGTPILARYMDTNDHQKTLLGVVNGSGTTATVDVVNNVADYLLRNYQSLITGGTIAATDDVKGAIAKLEKKIDDVSKDVTVDVVTTGSTGTTHFLTVVPSKTATGDTFTLVLTDVASAQDLADEIAARKAVDGQNGQTYAANTSANYISDASSLNDADVKLDAALKAEEDARKAIEGQNGSTYTQNTSSRYISGASSMNDADVKLDQAVSALSDNLDDIVDGLSASTVSGESKVVIDVTQEDGKITATAANLTGVKLDGYAEGTDADVAATDTLGQALGKLQAQINAMDKTADVVAGQVVTTVAEADGKVTETKANVKDLQLGGYSKTSDSGAISGTDTVNVALSKLENNIAAAQSATTVASADNSINVTPGTGGTDINVNIKNGEHVLAKGGNAGLYTDIKLSAVTPSSTAIKEEYSLIATDGSVLGTNIKIYKDSHIVSITYITDSGDTHYQNLEYKYIDDSGNTQTEYVDISSLVLEAEFASGVTITNHVAHGVVDPQSEKDENNDPFLTVGADGFKVDGIKNAIDTKINKLDVTGDTAAAGQYVAAIQEADGIVSVKTRANVSEAVLNNYAKGSDATAVAATDTVNQAISKLENQVDKAKAAATTVVREGVDNPHMEITSSTDSSTSATTYTITLTDVASDTALTAEIAARKAVDGQNGQTYAANSSANYINNATSLNDADVKLDAALKAEETARQAIEGQNGTTYTANASASIISGATDMNNADVLLNNAITGMGSDLADEIAARKAVDGINGDAYTANTGTNYISGASDLNNADVLLDTALKAEEDARKALSAKTFTAAAMTGGTVSTAATADGTVQLNINTDGSKVLLTGYDATGVTGDPVATDSVNAAIAKLYNKIDAGEVEAGSATTVVATSTGQKVDVKLDTTSTINEYDATHAQAVNNTSKNVLEITQNGLYLNNNWDCGTY